MKKYISTIIISIVAVAAPLSLSAGQMRVSNSAPNPNNQPPDNNVTYTETGDAGQTIATAQNTGPAGQPLAQIFGSIGSVGDADIYVISITSPGTFSATTVNAGTGANLDTSLFLFNSTGRPVYANDDDSGGLSLQSTLPAGNALGPVSAGIYYLAISLSGSEPVNFANQLLFATGASTDVLGPNPSATGPEVNFDSSLVDPNSTIGAYEIDLTGAATVPEPSVPATFILGSLVSAGIFFARKRGRAFSARRFSFARSSGNLHKH